VSRRLIANTVATTFAVAVGLFAIWASKTYLRSPSNLLDWTVLLFSGFMTGTFVFFLTWGHFQKDPLPDGQR
jgi:hypothetical protein